VQPSSRYDRTPVAELHSGKIGPFSSSPPTARHPGVHATGASGSSSSSQLAITISASVCPSHAAPSLPLRATAQRCRARLHLHAVLRSARCLAGSPRAFVVSPSPPPLQLRCSAPSPRCGRCSTAARPPRASAPRSLRTAAPCLQLAPGLPCPAAPRRFPLCHARRRARAAALGRTRPVHYLLHRRPPGAGPPRAGPLHLRLALAVGRAPQPQRLAPPAPSALLLPGAFVVVVVPHHRAASLADEPPFRAWCAFPAPSSTDPLTTAASSSTISVSHPCPCLLASYTGHPCCC